ncbi:hypothetical protein SEA_VIBAKI_24 [Arthrobacter phage Vibaki]|uniref:Minor tail protein n=1 Tax=Arthrobacter phage Vibaki TaxID=2593333 RepID=A0A514TZ20_9CAUD|nr:hypothetical protein HYP95_gp24 [Arthrobacter phage Vibaki]QDK01905.1 hypothetical protein SEA_VIBAKI_24 [Arthrobacter phage Vibaki]
MAITPTTRFVLKKYTSGGDPHPSRTEFNTMIDAIENNAGMYSQGTTAARPAAGKAGRWYWDQTVSRMYYDDGVAWQDQNPNGGGGAGAKVVPGAAAIEGVSTKAARADHTHTIDLATAAVDGAMPKADKAKLDAATDAATASALMRRDASGRVSVATPTTTGHATTKAYVDGAITTVGNAAADYADGAITAAPAATSTTAGKMSAADKVKLDAASAAATPNTIMMTDAAGRYKAAAPSASTDVANKAYVDTAETEANAYADAAVSAAPAATTTAAGKMSAADKTKLDNAVSAATASRLVIRDASGRAQFATPSAAADAATKSYVDTAITGANTYADTAESDAKAYADAAVTAIPLVTSAVDGKMRKADKAKLDAATSAATASTVVMRDSAGKISVATPTSDAHTATKAYVDTAESSAKGHADAAVAAAGAAGVTPAILSPLAVTGYSPVGTIAVENLGAYKRVTVDIGITRTGGGGQIPNDSFASFGPVLPAGARGDSGLQKYLPIAISGGALNTHATLFVDTTTGIMSIKAQTAFTIQSGATFTANLSYLIPSA